MPGMYETAIYYHQRGQTDPLEVRFHLPAETEAHAAALARKLMRESYAGEVNDSAFLARGATWLVPGVRQPKRLFGRGSPT